MRFSQKLLLPVCSAMLMAGGLASASTLITSTGFENTDNFNADTAGNTGGVNTVTPDGSIWKSGVVNSQYNGIWAGQNKTSGGELSAVLGNDGQYLTVDATGSDGVGTLNFWYSSYTGSTNATIEIQWTSDALDGSETWITADSFTVVSLDNAWHLRRSDIQQPGDIKLRWLINGTGGVSIDDVDVTRFVDPVIARTSFESSDGFALTGGSNTAGFNVTSTSDNAQWSSGVPGNAHNGIWAGQANTGTWSAVIGREGQYLQADPAGAEGVDKVRFSHISYTGSNSTISLQWTADVLDGSEQWTTAGSYQETGLGTEWATKEYTVNQSGDIKLRWLVSGAGGSSIDDVEITRKRPDLIKVAAVGDSITRGMGIADTNSSYPSQLQELLGDQYEVGNFGHSGARVSTISSKPYTETQDYQNALAFGADIIFIALGINDCSPGQWNVNKPVFARDYKAIIDSLRASGDNPEIYIGSLMPVVHPYGKYLEIHEQLPECRQYVEQVANDNNLPFIDLYTPLNSEENVYPDGLHPDATGAGIIAETVHKAITQEYGGLQMPWLFGDNMVIQRDKPIDVFGIANPEEIVTVELDGATSTATADENGQWSVSLAEKPAGGPFQLKISSNSGRSVHYENVMIGEVWVAAGQSNMAWEMRQDRDWNQEKGSTNDYPNIRILNRVGNPWPNNVVFNAGELQRLTVDNYYSGSWQNGSEQTVAPVSAVAYYFAREVHKETGITVGIIENAIGGASMEAYMPRTALNTPDLNLVMKDWLNADIAPEWHRGRAAKNLQTWVNSDQSTPMPHHPYEPTFLYDAEVADLMDFNFRGVLWYQGETNATDDNETAWDIDYNQKLFEGLIQSWRQEAGEADLPFYYVQLPNLNRNWAPFRDMQRRVLTDSGLDNLGMAVTLDLGHNTDVHPTNKIEVGKRLSLWARNSLYGESSLTYSGPIFNGDFIDHGATLEIGFDHVGNGLTTNSCGPLVGFEVAGSDGIWKTATATFSKDRVVVSSDDVADPQAVRYAWANNPIFNLYNHSGDFNGDDYQLLPASPFQAGNLNFN
ncbi:GDSL-type esterase/lipase family protein [Endozoicomonas elysicola]|uniref:GDSL-type esterase/lipase family protein n=1 Tax=Endozoicomonas elysicola TaxID=305900 RepID=UPI00037EBFCC|nr:GDSL-type esterase/lipase family protein [Endozoicomonas elysicola]